MSYNLRGAHFIALYRFRTGSDLIGHLAPPPYFTEVAAEAKRFNEVPTGNKYQS